MRQADSPPNTSQIVELRRYALHPGARETLIELFDRELVETQEELGMQVLGQFRDLDDPDSFVWLRGFSDMETRKSGLEGFYGGPVWKANAQAANATMIDSDNVLLLHPIAGLSLDGRARASPGSTASPSGLLVVTIYPLSEGAASDFAAHFQGTVQPQLAAAGVHVIGTYETEHSPNTFPALPVREGEEVFVWMAIYADETDHATRVSELERLPGWSQAISTQATRLSGNPEVLRLRPTARSRLHA